MYDTSFCRFDINVPQRDPLVNEKKKTLDEIETTLYNIPEVICMNECWNDAVVTKISAAVYVAPDTGKHVHKNRPYHGLVLNDADSVKDYVFDDGRVMRTEVNSLFYLPKHSSYYVKQYRSGGCYAINFDAEICDRPFCIPFRNTESVLHSFKAACDGWRSNSDQAALLAMRALYDGICRMQREEQRRYTSGRQLSLISPAIQEIDRSFTENELSVSRLASLCGISEVYFRRLFMNTFGISPKEYVIQKRMEYAKTLLSSGDFSVSEAAMLCGYAEPCHFSREFSKRVGVSPKQYENS